MRYWVLALLFVVSVSFPSAAQEPAKSPLPSASPPPMLTKAQLSADGKSLQLVKTVLAAEQYTVTKTVPQTVVVVEGGQEVAKTVTRQVSETATRMVCKSVCEPVNLEQIELRSASGGHYTLEDISKFIGTEPMPVIALQRQLKNENGQIIAKTMDFDRSFLQLFKPDALVLVLPPPATAAVPLPAPAPPSPQPNPPIPGYAPQ
jgi:hypothetical protein